MKKTSKIQKNLKDPKKDSLIKELVEKLMAFGYKVRKEKLKAGPGWRVVSGSCRIFKEKVIFLDPRITQDDQILFLQSYIPSV